MINYRPLAIAADALAELRRSDDSDRPMEAYAAGSEDDLNDSVGSPLRCCLRPIEAGERVTLVSYAPLRRWAAEAGGRPGAYDEAGPVFIHADPCAGPAEDATGYPFARPGALRTIRRYNARGQIVGGRLFEIPEDADAGFDHQLGLAFADAAVALVHVRAVEYGCFQFEVRRPTA